MTAHPHTAIDAAPDELGGLQHREELLSIVSHELRTPLVSTLGFANLLLADPALEGETRRAVETIRGETARGLTIVDNLLGTQRFGDGYPGDRQPFDLLDVLEEQVHVFQATAAAHEVRLQRPAGPLAVEADRGWIAQVLANLLSNAVKYSPQGGTVRVSAGRLGGRVRVTVADEGIGIPRDQRDRVFTMFARVEMPETQNIQGLGIGLALCREILAEHGGTIDFASVPGQGSTFWFELPVG